MAKRLLLRDAENLSADQLQRILGSQFWNLPVVGGVGTGYSAGIVGKTPTASTGHLAVTANGTTMVLTMLPGWASVVRDAGGSTYDPRILFAESDANDTATVTANATGSTRNDTVCLKIDMATAPTTDGSNLVSFVIIAGQSGGGVSNAPADGNLYLPLANVAVANGATSIAQGNVTDKRTSILAMGSPIWVPPAYGAAFPPIGYSSFPVKLDEQSGASNATGTLTVPAAAVGQYRTLEIDFTGRTDNAAVQALLTQFNGDVGGNYDYQITQDINVTVTGVAPTVAGTTGRCGVLIPSGATAGAVSAFRIVIENADSLTLRKNWNWIGGGWSTDAAASAILETGQGQWRNTANALSTILLKAGAGNLTNWRATLWGKS
jgi:hypothetical protein